MSSIFKISKIVLYVVWNSSLKNIWKMSKIIVDNRLYLRFINVEWKHHSTTFLQHVINAINLCLFKFVIKRQQSRFYLLFCTSFTKSVCVFKMFFTDIPCYRRPETVAIERYFRYFMLNIVNLDRRLVY